MVQSHIPFRIADTGYRISRFVCFEDYKHTDIHLLSGLVASAIRIADQWERAVVLRMGKYNGLKGPGPFMIIPVIGQCVDLY